MGVLDGGGFGAVPGPDDAPERDWPPPRVPERPWTWETWSVYATGWMTGWLSREENVHLRFDAGYVLARGGTQRDVGAGLRRSVSSWAASVAAASDGAGEFRAVSAAVLVSMVDWDRVALDLRPALGVVPGVRSRAVFDPDRRLDLGCDPERRLDLG